MNIRFDFIGSINDDNTLALRNFIDSQAHIKPISSLTINISSLGGCVASGITIYNYLKQQPFPIATHNLGEVSSAALLLYLAGSTRTAAPVSKFMIHPIKIGISGDFPYFQVEELLKSIDMDIKNYARIVDSETNSLNKQYTINTLLRSDSLALDRVEAKQCGIVTTLQ